MFKTAVIGLGNIGFQLGLDPNRKEVWSHVAAYDKCEETVLAGVVEIDKNKIKQFKEYFKAVPIFETVDELLRNLNIDIISICTPTSNHYAIFKEVIKYPLKAIFCEKPLAFKVSDAKEMVKICRQKKIVLTVNHSRRWYSSYRFAEQIITAKNIGNVKAVNTLYPGQIFNIGTHLFDTVRMLIHKNARMAAGVSFNIGNPDPSISGWISLDGKIPCTFISTGRREDLIFEIDIVGNEGRVRVLENGEKVKIYTFVKSRRYSGYRELVQMPLKIPLKNDRLLEAVNDICAVIGGVKREVSCTGEDGLSSLILSCALVESAKNKGRPINLEGKYAV